MSTIRARMARTSVLATAVALALCLFAPEGFGQQNPTVLFSAGAYGTTAWVGNTVKVGQTAPVSIGSGCGTAQVGVSQNGTLASVSAAPLVNTGVVDTTGWTTANSSTGSADLYQLNLLGGLITAQEVKSVSTTSIDSSHALHESAAGSKFVDLVVLGSRIQSTPAPNTTIELAGFGRLVLNEQILSSGSEEGRFTVNMLHLYITTSNVLGLPLGAQVIVSSARSGIELVAGPAAVEAYSYGTSIHSLLLNSSPTAPAYVGCRGSDGHLVTTTLVSVNLPHVLYSGTVTDTGKGLVSSAGVSSQSTSKIQGLNLLSGLVSAGVIQASAGVSSSNGESVSLSDSGSFLNLSIAGHPEIKDNVAPNTQINIANLGTLYLHRVIEHPNGISVVMVELVVNHTNVLGLPLGADIRVGYAEAYLHSAAHP
jgi:hypothetical protein